MRDKNGNKLFYDLGTPFCPELYLKEASGSCPWCCKSCVFSFLQIILTNCSSEIDVNNHWFKFCRSLWAVCIYETLLTQWKFTLVSCYTVQITLLSNRYIKHQIVWSFERVVKGESLYDHLICLGRVGHFTGRDQSQKVVAAESKK